jgi:hypothetical protein
MIYCSNENTGYPLSSNRVKLEKYWVSTSLLFAGWQVLFEPANQQNIPEDQWPESTH